MTNFANFRSAVERLDPRNIYILPAPPFTWESQAVQYPVSGVPGITLERHFLDLGTGVEVFPHVLIELDNVTQIDCLLHRDRHGLLDGILNHYDGKCELEVKDAVNIWVRPNAQRTGIATALLAEALERWPGITGAPQRFPPDGIALLSSLIRRVRGTP